MKVKLAISPEILEDLVTIEAQAMSEQVSHLMTYIQNLDKRIKARTFFVLAECIICFV
ncbi:TPA: hypothetical protein ACGO17_001020 [Streptococcus suis]